MVTRVGGGVDFGIPVVPKLLPSVCAMPNVCTVNMGGSENDCRLEVGNGNLQANVVKLS